MKIYPNTIKKLYYIFLRKKEDVDDSEILKYLGLSNYQLKGLLSEYGDEIYNFTKPTIWITECKDWIHIIDSFYCEMWFSMIRNWWRIEELSNQFDIFTCMVGDADDSINYHYYKDGELIRKYIFDQQINGNVLKEENFGDPLTGEFQPKETTRHLEYVLKIAASLGINLNHNAEKVRLYENPDWKDSFLK